ncbi:MAG: ABC transporter substrate-binding protein, partial [Methanothrix sp.]|nr:ABC transporter substrate-binding protein [Methanothrix sp.]
LAALGLVVLALGCGGDDNETTGTPASTAGTSTAAGSKTPSGEPINILAVLSLAGSLQPYGEIEKAVAEIVVDDWNADGGILGRPVKLTVENDSGDSTQGVATIQQKLNSSKFDWVLPLFNDIPAGPALADAKVMNSSWDSNSILADTTKYPYTFNTPNLNDTGAKAMLNYLTKTLKAKKIAVLYASDFVSPSFEQEFETAAKGFDVQVVGVESFAPDALDTTPQLIKLRDASPDVLVLSALPPAVGQALKDRTKLAWTVPVVGDNGVASIGLSALVGAADLEGVSLLAYKAGTLTSSGQVPTELKDFLAKVKAKIGASPPFPFYDYVMVHDTMQLIKVGIEGAGSSDAQKVTKYLEGMSSNPPTPYPFLLQKMNFTAQRHFPDNVNAFTIAKAGALTDGFHTWQADIPQ